MFLNILKIATKMRHTRNKSRKIWNFARDNDTLDSRAVLRMNALREWGVKPPDKIAGDMDEKQL